MKNHIPPLRIEKGDKRLLINGNPPKVNCRVIAEAEYQTLRECYDLIKGLEYILHKS